MIFWVSWPYVLSSWSRFEDSREAGGLPGLFLLKTVILVFCVLIGLQALSMAARAILTLTGRPQDDGDGGDIDHVRDGMGVAHTPEAVGKDR